MTKFSIPITRLTTSNEAFEDQLNKLLCREMLVSAEVTQAVTKILHDVKRRQDLAVLEYTNKYDGFGVSSIEELFIPCMN